MSIYRSFKRAPRSDVHLVSEHIAKPERVDPQVAPTSTQLDWISHRKANPSATLLPAAVRWLAALPIDVRPVVLSEMFPRIANAFAALWNRPEELARYFDDLLMDRRGGRRGFPVAVLAELHALKAHSTALPSAAAPASRGALDRR